MYKITMTMEPPAATVLSACIRASGFQLADSLPSRIAQQLAAGQGLVKAPDEPEGLARVDA